MSSAPPVKSRRRWLLGGVAVAAAATGAGLALWRTRLAEPEGDAAALLLSLSLNDPAGQPVAFERWRGKPLVVNFWATWCPPCVQEMPELSKIRDEFAPKGTEIVGIAIDSPSAVREFAVRKPVSYPLVIGGMGGTELVRRFGNPSGALPYTVLIGRDGRVAWRHMGLVSPDDLRAALRTAGAS